MSPNIVRLVKIEVDCTCSAYPWKQEKNIERFWEYEVLNAVKVSMLLFWVVTPWKSILPPSSRYNPEGQHRRLWEYSGKLPPGS
jgi:hypothetical protein